MSSDSGVHHKKLGWFLCWAVVFADVGTSLYYTPGILFGQVKNLAGLFVLLTSIVFILLSMKYVEITDRYPEGGGVVTVATNAFGPWWGALGGMLITVDYFLTASISSVSGFAYLNSIVHIGSYITIAAVIGIILLGILNIIGIKESAGFSAVVAIAAFIVDIILVGFVATQVGPEGWHTVFHSITAVSSLRPWAIMTGFAGSFLAFSGLESISQLSPVMAEPRRKVAGWAMTLLVFAILLTSPLLTLFSTNLITAKVPNSTETILESVSKVDERTKQLATISDPAQKAQLQSQIDEGNAYSSRFISELGAQYGGTAMKIAVVITASILLLFAANTAIIGAYHVFIALSRQNFFPKFLENHNVKFDTPHNAVILATVAPIIIILATKGNVDVLGSLYAFGLLGAFTLSSLGLDVVRWREGKNNNLLYWVGVLTTVLVVIAWCTNLYSKQLATIFGGTITLIGMVVAYIINRYFPHETKEQKAEKSSLVTTTDKIKTGEIFVPVFDEFDAGLFEYAANLAKHDNRSVIVMYIREFADILQSVSEDISLDDEAAKYLKRAKQVLSEQGVAAEFLYDSTSNTGDLINEYRKQLKPEVTVLSPDKNSRALDFLQGDIIETVIRHKDGNVLIYTGK